MKPAPASSSLAVAAAACAVVVLGACETVRTEKWRRGSIGGSEYEKRMDESVQRNIRELNALAAGDESADFTRSQFNQESDIKTDSNPFGKKLVGNKSYRTRDFEGADEYKDGDYHFLKRQEYDSGDWSNQSREFATGEAADERKRFFGRRKKARTKDYADNNKLIRSSSYRDTQDDIERLGKSNPNIVRDDAADAGATLSVDDVRTMLHGPQ